RHQAAVGDEVRGAKARGRGLGVGVEGLLGLDEGGVGLGAEIPEKVGVGCVGSTDIGEEVALVGKMISDKFDGTTNSEANEKGRGKRPSDRQEGGYTSESECNWITHKCRIASNGAHHGGCASDELRNLSRIEGIEKRQAPGIDATGRVIARVSVQV